MTCHDVFNMTYNWWKLLWREGSKTLQNVLLFGASALAQ